MKRLNLFLTFFIILFSTVCAIANPVEITRTINLVDVWLRPGVAMANDFHIVFKANDLDGIQIQESYLDPSGYYCSLAGAACSVWSDAAGFIHVEWSFADICVDPSNPASFGFTLLGGMTYEAVDWYWTYNGVRIQDYDDVWQDWVRVGNELQDIIINRTQTDLKIQRTTGIQPSAVAIADVATMINPPNPNPPEIQPIPAPPVTPIIYPWPWPAGDPTYYMYYDLYDADGTLIANFRNAAVLQEIPDENNVKWEQPPDLTPNGIDIRVDDADGVVRHIADDFECTQTGPITDIHFWGSWENDDKGTINSIVYRIYSDDPVGMGGSNPDNQFSNPDQLLWEKQFTGTEIIESLYKELAPDYEWWWDPYFEDLRPNGDQNVWKYDVYIDEEFAFIQSGTPDVPIVYWLEIQANVSYNPDAGGFGWKTSTDHWNDDAVFANGANYPWISGWRELRYPEQHELYPESLDMAFMITTSDSNEPNEPTNVKWKQPPDLTPNGIDIRVDDADGVVRHIADDFECTQTGPITDIHFWGSWEDDDKGTINSIVYRIYSDDPVGMGGSNPDNQFSNPDQLLWEKQFTGTEIIESLFAELAPDYEWWWDPYFWDLRPDGDQNVWKYDVYIDEESAFIQEGSPDNPIVYWLEIQANVNYKPDANGFGWKTSTEHWNDDAVFANGANYPWISGWRELRYPEGHELYPESLDMAFMITTAEVNEPNEPKWEQLPDLSIFGIDIDATEPYILADDFECVKTELITKITVWGSWLDDILPEQDPSMVRFTLSIHEDIPNPDPTDPMSYSMPGEVRWLYFAEPGTFTVEIEKDQILEGWWSPIDPMGYIFPGDTICWKYTFNIPRELAFCQKGTADSPIVYWLDLKAEPLEPTGEARFGWKTSIEHWNDDSVWGMGAEPYMGPWQELQYPMQHELFMQSIDLAFAIESNEPCIEAQAEVGDAPDSTNTYGLPMTAYYGPGIMANFPTVYNTGSPPYGPMHRQPTTAFYLGQRVTLENEADIGLDQDGINNLLVFMNSADLDGADDGLPQMPYLPRCRMVKFDYIVTVVDSSKPIFTNVWFDWTRDGDWDDVATCDLGQPADEWAVQDQPLTFTSPGTYVVSTPPFRAYDNIDMTDIAKLWMRITVSDTPWQPSGASYPVGGSGPMGGYMFGETEDYLFVPDTSCWDCGDFDLSGQVDYFDLKVLTDNWLWLTTGFDHREADLDCDGDIEFTDFAIFAENWLGCCP